MSGPDLPRPGSYDDETMRRLIREAQQRLRNEENAVSGDSEPPPDPLTRTVYGAPAMPRGDVPYSPPMAPAYGMPAPRRDLRPIHTVPQPPMPKPVYGGPPVPQRTPILLIVLAGIGAFAAVLLTFFFLWR